jgi:hypothetical protein
MTILSIWTTLETVRETVLSGKIEALSSTAAVLAAILAAATLLKLSKDYIQGQPLDIWDLLRPIILLTLVCLFRPMVLDPLDSIVNVFTRDAADAVSVSTGEYVKEWAENIGKMDAYTVQNSMQDAAKEIAEIAEDRSGIGRFFCTAWIAIKKVIMHRFHLMSMGIGTLVGAILFLFVKILLFIQQILCNTYLMMNSLLGPFIMALAILPGYETGLKNWIARYIQIAMWIPIGYFVMYINLQVGKAFCTLAAAGQTGLAMDWFMIALQIVALVSIASVPKMAAWVIESTGANDAHSALSQPARQMARKFMKF